MLEDAGIPWVGAVGNHDGQAVTVGGSARPGVDVHAALRETWVYNQYFGASHFALRAGTAEGTEDASYHLFSAEGTQWMVLALELWPRQDKLDWAKQIVAAHPERNVIIVTHDYLDGSGNVVTRNGGYGDVAPTVIRDQLVKPYANVKMVFSGHEGFHASRVDDYPGHHVVALQENYDEARHSDVFTRMVRIDVNAGTITHSYATVDGSRVEVPDTTVDQRAWVR